jgi:hypothetical protein
MSSIMRLRNGVIVLSFRVVIGRRARPAPHERISRPRHTGDCLLPSRRSRPFNHGSRRRSIGVLQAIRLTLDGLPLTQAA